MLNKYYTNKTIKYPGIWVVISFLITINFYDWRDNIYCDYISADCVTYNNENQLGLVGYYGKYSTQKITLCFIVFSPNIIC